jgi:hypothetical protein
MLRRADWSPLDGTLVYPPPDRPEQDRPQNFELMLQWASELGLGLDFIRVDLYNLGDRVLVGELTPYPEAGRGRFQPKSLDAWLGAMWHCAASHCHPSD